jgi:hypothetical protein
MSVARMRPFLCRALIVSPLVALFCAVEARGAQVEPPAATGEAPVQAIWKPQEVEFYFQSFTTFYSCSSLEAKVKRLLIAVGAQKGLKVSTRGCFSSSEIARMPRVEIELTSPVEVSPEVLAELDKTRSTRELTARVRGDSKQADAQEQQFAAQWQRVSLSRGKLNLEPGDCELVEQLKKKVFPKLAIRIVEDEVQCVPNQLTMTQPRLIVEALMPMAAPDAKKDGS